MSEAAPLLTGTAVPAEAKSLEEDAKALLSAVRKDEDINSDNFSLQPPSRQLAVIILAGSLRRIRDFEPQRAYDADRFCRALLSSAQSHLGNCLKDASMWVDESRGMSLRGTSVMSLLAETEANVISRSLLTNPALVHALESTWRDGLSGPATAVRFKPVYSVDTGNQPRLQHLWSLAAYLILLYLSVSLAVAPLQQHEIFDAGPYLVGREIAWVIMGWSHVGEVLLKQRRASQLIYLLPTLAALLLVTLGQRPSLGAAHSWICWSLPVLFTRLVVPLSPSIVLLDPTRQSSSLPLAILLHGIIQRNLQAVGLIAPVILLVFAIFSWTLNGDVYRGLTALTSWISIATTPSEPGVAPYESRLALAVTVLLLLLLALLLASARTAVPADVDDDDVWVRHFGTTTTRLSQQALIATLIDFGVGLSIVSEKSTLHGMEYGSTSNAVSSPDDDPEEAAGERHFRILALDAPALVPPFNLVGLVFASLPAQFIRTMGRNAPLASRYERTVRWWTWRLTTGWISWIIVQIATLWKRLAGSEGQRM